VNINHTGGRWDRAEAPRLFLAGDVGSLEMAESHPWILVAVNELRSERELETLERLIGEGRRLLIDSGIFSLTNEHMRAHGCTMDAALALPPDQIDGFAALWTRYL
jgi:hypothetical protein